MDLTPAGIVLYVLGAIAFWLFSRSKINGIREENEARIKAIHNEASAKVTAANIDAEARSDKQRLEWSDHFFKTSQRLETALDKLREEYTRAISSNANLQGQVDLMRADQVEAGKRSQVRDQLLGEQKAQLLEANRQILAQSQRLGELEVELTKTRASEASAIETAEGYRQELDKAQEALSDLKRQVEALQTQVEELTQEVQRLRTELDIVKAERDRLHEELQRANALLNALQDPDPSPNAPLVDFDLGKTQKVDTQGITGPFTEPIQATNGEPIERLPQ